MNDKNLLLRHSLTIFLISLLGSLLISCSASNPTETDAIKLLEDWSKQDFENLYKVKSLRKTNGQASEVFGVEQYSLSYEAELECLKLKAATFFGGPEPIVCEDVGEVQTVFGTLRFEKTEKGWESPSFRAHGDTHPIIPK